MYDMYMYSEKIYVWERDMEREREERESVKSKINLQLVSWIYKILNDNLKQRKGYIGLLFDIKAPFKKLY